MYLHPIQFTRGITSQAFDSDILPSHLRALNSAKCITDIMHIDDYDFGRISIDGKSYKNDVIILPDQVYSDWWRREGHELHPDDLSRIIEAEPDLLIVGKGYYGRMKVLESAKNELDSIGCEIIARKTKAACELYNERSAKENVVAALHLTC